MGRMIEINTMLHLKEGDIDLYHIKVENEYKIIKSGIRLYPMNLSILLLNEEWSALGFCMITKTISENDQMEVTFKILSIFTPEEQQVVTKTMSEALDLSGYKRI